MATQATPPPPTNTPTTAKLNPNWIRTTFASFALAVLLRVGLGVPILTTLITVGIIFLTHIIFTEMRTGVMTVLGWMKFAGNMAMGVVIFLALRFLVGGVIGKYPIDTYGEINSSGGLYGILPGKEMSKVILFELCFAFVAGGLSVAWANGKGRRTVGTIFVLSVLVLGTQIALPNYVKTSWATREAVETNLANDGVVGATFKGAKVLLFGPSPTPTPQITTTRSTSSTPTGPCQGPWEVRELEVPAGGLPVYVCWGWTSWADGPVTMTTPDGKTYHDRPGAEKTPVDIRNVTVIFRADPKGSSRRVYVKNRW